MIQLHFAPGTASMIPHIVLEELGIPYERITVDRERQAHKAPDYLKLNPNGLIPVLTDGDLVLYETAAICLHLADTHPASGLMPALGTHERAHAYKWLAWLTNSLQTSLITCFFPERWVNPGNTAGASEVQERALSRVEGLLDQIDAELARHAGPWFGGQTFSVLDAYVFTLCSWTAEFARPARTYTAISPYLQRMLGRGAVKRVLANEGLVAPFV